MRAYFENDYVFLEYVAIINNSYILKTFKSIYPLKYKFRAGTKLDLGFRVYSFYLKNLDKFILESENELFF